MRSATTNLTKVDFDVVIVGAGINGLACGCYLQKAGLDVAVVEKRNECGPFALTEDLFGGGLPVDTHAGVCFITMSPVWGDLELGRFGLELLLPDVAAGTLWRDRNLLYYYDLSRTREELARYSERDAATFLDFYGKITPDLPEILQRGVFSPPTEEGEDYLFSLGSYIGFDDRDMRSMNGVEMLDLLYEDDHVKMSMLGISNIAVFGDPAEKGEGAVMTLLAWALGIAVPSGGMHNLVHALVRCFRHHGGTLMLNAPVAEVSWEGGRPKGVILDERGPYPFDELRARHAVVMHTSPPVSAGILGMDKVEALDHGLWRKMRDWDMTGHCAFTSYYLLDQPIEWGSRVWNPDVQRCPYPLRAWDTWEQAKTSFQAMKNEELFAVAGDVGEIYNLGSVDPTRVSSDGHHAVVFEVEYPMNLRRYGGVQAWDDRDLTDRLHQSHTENLETLAPGTRQHILKSTYFTPIDNWRRNPSAVYGHELGGDVSGAQWYQGRMPARTPIEGLYFSNGIWPASLTHLGNGYVAAGCVAEDLGVRDQTWWRHRPMELMYELVTNAGKP